MKEIDEIIKGGEQFLNDLQKDEHGRYKSWEYCYKEFQNAHKLGEKIKNDYIDYLCLHLSFYLASWGMYRSSSFLLQKDYKIHEEAVRELLNSEYNELWAIDVKDLKKESNLNKLDILQQNLKDIYKKYRTQTKNKEVKQEVSDILITKILLGTMGCVPAYDRFFKDGVRNYKNIATGIFNSNSIKLLAEFYEKEENYEKFESLRKEMTNDTEFEYPQMKIIDCCFWQIGYNLNPNETK